MHEHPAEPGPGRGDADVAHRRELGAHPDRRAVDGADDRLRAGHQRGRRAGRRPRAPSAALVLGRRRQVRQVGAGAERAGHPGQDDGPGAVIVRGGVEGLPQLVDWSLRSTADTCDSIVFTDRWRLAISL